MVKCLNCQKIIEGYPCTNCNFPKEGFIVYLEPGRRFTKAMEIKFTEQHGHNRIGLEITNTIIDKKTKYLRLGYAQNPRKVEMAKCGAATTKKRGPAEHII